jgi:hypothetical protein
MIACQIVRKRLGDLVGKGVSRCGSTGRVWAQSIAKLFYKTSISVNLMRHDCCLVSDDKRRWGKAPCRVFSGSNSQLTQVGRRHSYLLILKTGMCTDILGKVEDYIKDHGGLPWLRNRCSFTYLVLMGARGELQGLLETQG